MKHKIFYRYLFSYIGIFLLPVLVMTTVISMYFMNILKSEIAVNNINSMRSIMDSVDTQLSRINNLREQIYINKNMRTFHFEDNPLGALEKISVLEEYKLTNSFLDDIYVLYGGENFLFSSRSSVNSKYFFENKYICDALGIEAGDRKGFYEKLSSNPGMYFKLPKASLSSEFYDDNGEQIIVFSYADYNVKKVEKIVFFTMLEKNFKNMIIPAENISGVINIILNENNDFVTTTDDREEFHDSSFLRLIEEVEKGKRDEFWHKLKRDGGNYIMSYVKSSFSGWKFISVIPEKITFSKFYTTKSVFLIVLCMILIVGCSLVIILINKNYMPIKNLAHMSERLLKDDVVGDELEVICDAINYLDSMNVKLKNQIHENEHPVKEYLIFRLLNGKFNSREEFNQQGKVVKLQFTKPLYTVACVYVKNNLGVEWTGLIPAAEKYISRELECCIRDDIESNRLVLILAFDIGSADKIDGLLENVRMFIKGKTGLPITIGVGGNYPFNEIYKSFIEAKSALDYRFIKGIDRIIHMDEISISKTMIDKSVEDPTGKLKTLIKRGEIEPIENLLSNIIRYIKKGDISVISARIICINIINTAVDATKKLLDKAENSIVMQDYPDAFQLSEIETVDDVADIIKGVCMDISKLMILQKDNKRDISDIDRMVIYVKNNYTNCDWTLQMMAEHFHMALPNLSAYFKERTGENLISYVSELRIEKAKAMLEETNLRLKDICIECGYYNDASFIRRFKQIEGMTPGEYREQVRGKR